MGGPRTVSKKEFPITHETERAGVVLIASLQVNGHRFYLSWTIQTAEVDHRYLKPFVRIMRVIGKSSKQVETSMDGFSHKVFQLHWQRIHEFAWGQDRETANDVLFRSHSLKVSIQILKARNNQKVERE